MDDPIAVLLKFAFLAVLYLFLLWIARSALKDLGRSRPSPIDGSAGPADGIPRAPLLIVVGGGGLQAGAQFAIDGSTTIGRSPQAEVRIDDSFASARHARIYEREGLYYVEDMGSTNGTYLNERQLRSQKQLRGEDRIRIGDTEFRYQQ
jgi:pSer/pThr/pTyr-binding forkhead associated (FHA) protein